MGRHVVDLFERGIRPNSQIVVWESMSRKDFFRVWRPEERSDLRVGAEGGCSSASG
jgi:hypothetical protein